MNPFLREKPDGRRAAGYLTYLAGGLAVAAGILVLHRRWEASPPAPARSGRHRGAAVAPITQAAAAMAPVKVAGQAPSSRPRSYRLDEPASAPAGAAGPAPGSPPSFDAIDAALKETPGSAAGSNRPLDAGGAAPASGPAPEFAPLPPAFLPESPHGPGAAEGKVDRPPLLGYRDPAADAGSGEAEPMAAAAAAPSRGEVLPRGTLIYVYLLTTVDTSNPAAVIQFAAARPVVFGRSRELAFGTRFLGRLSGRPVRDRLNLAADTVLFPNGAELPLNASAVEADEAGGNIRPGLAALCFPPPAWVQTAPYLSDLFTGFTGLLESRAERQLSLTVGGVGVQTSSAGDVSAPLEQASAQALRDFTRARLKEVEDRYALYYLVPAGTACWLQLESDLAVGPGARSARPAPAAAPPQVGRLPLSPADSSAHAHDVPN